MNAFRTTAPGDAGSGFRPRVLLISADRGAGGVVARTLQASGRFGMIGEAVSVDEAVQVAPTVAPDVVLLELPPSTPAVEGALRPLRDCVPAAKMVIWTSG